MSTFYHRQMRETRHPATPDDAPSCADCGAKGVPEWAEVTTWADPPGVHRFIVAGWKCPNGPHDMRNQSGSPWLPQLHLGEFL